MVFQVLQLTWPSLVAVLAAAGASTVMRGQRKYPLAALAAALAAGAGFATAWVLRAAVSAPTGEALIRDVLGAFVVGAAAPLLALATARLAARRSSASWTPGALAALVGFIWIGVSPLLLLLVHCSSGDCL
jgi:hypothetical protein